MKDRLRKLSQKDFVSRFRVKYKKLIRLRCNLLISDKFLKLTRTKWLSLTLKYPRRLLFSSRIFSLSPATVSTFPTVRYNKTPIYHPLYANKYKFLLRSKNLFQFWYGLKRFKTLKSLYFKKLERYNSFTNRLYYVSRLMSLIIAFEHRLDVLIFRTYFFPSIFYAQKFIFNKHILVNKQLETYFNRIVRQNDIITLNGLKTKIFIKKYLLYITKRKFQPKYLMLLNYPHLEINYKIFYIRIQDLLNNFDFLSHLYPFNLNLHVLQSFFDSKL